MGGGQTGLVFAAGFAYDKNV